MLTYLLRRTLFSVVMLVLASVAVFVVVGGLGRPGSGGPTPGEYFVWVGGLLRGDLGTSYLVHVPVASVIAQKAWPTGLLLGSSLVLTVILGVSFGVYSAIRRRSLADRAGRAFFFVGYSLPTFWLAAMLQLALGVWLVQSAGLHLFPVSGMYTPGVGGLADLLRHLILPVLTLSLASMARFVRFQRGAMLDVLTADYVQTARAKGLRSRRVYLKHALRNALAPTVTLVALSMSTITGALAVVEFVFAWPGLGYLMMNSVFYSDFDVLRVLLMLNVLLVIFFNLLADLAYALLDPRVIHER